MDNNLLATQVADALKGLITASVKSVNEGNCQNAGAYLDHAFSITEMLEYPAGSAMVLYNYANLHMVAGDKIAAMEAAALALEKANLAAQADTVDLSSYQELAQNLSISLQIDGAACVKKKDYRGALSLFEAALPHAAADKKTLLERQITLIRKVLDGR